MNRVPTVPELLRIGAKAPAHVDPLDAVMGEDWAHLELGRGGRARPPAPLRRGGRRKRAALGGVLAPNPQALVKLIRSGGTSNAQGLRAQMTYLGRNGDVPMRGSESSFGVELGAADAGDLAAAWGIPETDRGGADRTSHFVVSFPRDTDPAAAERAGRAWAAELFDSGAYGDRWDYYTAFHTDTPYPHIHVVVGRRGLERDSWLRISARSEITFDRLREVQVEVAGREGIALTGTSRLSRGVHERPVPDAEYRRARAERRAPVPPEHTLGTARAAAAEVLGYARIYDGAAEAIRDAHPEFAERLNAAAEIILDGRALSAGQGRVPVSAKEAREMAETVEQIEAEVRRNFRDIEAEIAQVRDPARRTRFLRDLAELKAEGVDYLREDPGLQAYRRDALHADYRGLRASEHDPGAAAIKAEADRAVAAMAERFGLRPEATMARHAAEQVSLGLGRDYRAQEIAERAASRAERGDRPERPERAEAGIAEFHREAGALYRAAAERLRARELERAADDRTGEGPDAERPRSSETRRPLEDLARKELEARARGETPRGQDRDDDERGR